MWFATDGMSDHRIQNPRSAIVPSPVETGRFGLRVFRGTLEELNEQDILDAVVAHDIDIVILRLPAEKEHQLHRLNRTGLPWLAADTLVWYESDLTRYDPKEPERKDIAFLPTRPEHAASLDELVADIFTGYHNHYASNPLLGREAIVASYQDWTRNYITDEAKGRISWLVRKDENFVAFVTCAFSRDRAEIVLNGVRPSAAGQGTYTDLVRFVQRHFKSRGVDKLRISTQSHNYAVQRIWNREGFRLRNAVVTIHVNALMHHSVVEPCRFELPASVDALALWRTAVRIAGERCWSQPPIGPGVHDLGCVARFLLLAATPVRVVISTPLLNAGRGTGRSLLKVMDQDNRLCLFSYHDFALRPR